MRLPEMVHHNTMLKDCCYKRHTQTQSQGTAIKRSTAARWSPTPGRPARQPRLQGRRVSGPALAGHAALGGMRDGERGELLRLRNRRPRLQRHVVAEPLALRAVHHASERQKTADIKRRLPSYCNSMIGLAGGKGIALTCTVDCFMELCILERFLCFRVACSTHHAIFICSIDSEIPIRAEFVASCDRFPDKRGRSTSALHGVKNTDIWPTQRVSTGTPCTHNQVAGGSACVRRTL